MELFLEEEKFHNLLNLESSRPLKAEQGLSYGHNIGSMATCTFAQWQTSTVVAKALDPSPTCRLRITIWM